MGISVAHPQSGYSSNFFQVELEFGNVSFCAGTKTGVPRENPSEQGREPKTNSTHIWCETAGIEPRPHWWEGSALSTAPSLLSQLWNSSFQILSIPLTTDVVSLSLFFHTSCHHQWVSRCTRAFCRILSPPV